MSLAPSLSRIDQSVNLIEQKLTSIWRMNHDLDGRYTSLPDKDNKYGCNFTGYTYTFHNSIENNNLSLDCYSAK